MALVHHQEEIVWEVVQQRCGGRPRRTAGQHGRVVFNTLAHADFLQHFHIVVRALLDTLCLEKFAFLGEFFDLFFHFGLDLFQAFRHLFRADNIVAGRENRNMAYNILMLTGQRVKLDDAVNLVAKELYPDGVLIVVSQVDVHRVPFHAELVADKVHVVALILQFDQAAAQFIAFHLHTGAQANDHAAVVDRVAQ